jgi:LysM repeat protein
MERNGGTLPSGSLEGNPWAQLARRAVVGLALVVLLVACTGCRSVRPEAVPRREPPALSTVDRAEPQEFFVYQVRRGDTLSSLGARFRVPWHVIAEDNEIRDPRQLKVGQILFIRHVEGVEVPDPLGAEEPVGAPAARRPVSRDRLHRGKPDSPMWWPTGGTLLRRYGEAVRGLPEPGIAIAAPRGTEVMRSPPVR